MRAFKLVVVMFLIFHSFFDSFAQEKEKKWKFDGYAYGLFMHINSQFMPNQYNGQVYNRLNFFYNPNQFSTFTVQFRNTLLLGDWVIGDKTMAKTLNLDMGAVDLSVNALDFYDFLLNVNVDRAYYQYSKNKLELTIGRQRVNWGRTLVWNPNDIFNASSFFEFDYVEKPGSDAARLVYYINSTSSLDFALKVDSAHRLTYAGKYDFNYKGYDIQLIGGVFQDDITAGFGWAGNLKKMGFKGESMFFWPVFDTLQSSVFNITAALDYSFNNGLYVLCQAMFTQLNGNQSIANFLNFYAGNINARNLSFSKWNLLGQAVYSFNPIISGSFSAMYYPDFNSFFVFPSATFSVAKNFDLSLIYQYFHGSQAQQKLSLHFVYAGLKYYF